MNPDFTQVFQEIGQILTKMTIMTAFLASPLHFPPQKIFVYILLLVCLILEKI
jgi:hypothetical protein